MLFFLTLSWNRQTIDRYVATRGRRFFWDMQTLPYERMLSRRRFASGTYVFTDLELLSGGMRRAVERLWETIRSTRHCRTLNAPSQVPDREALLKRFAARGLNTHRAFQPTESPAGLRFPVFLRIRDDHEGARSPLLRTQTELHAALANVPGDERARWLVVEFCDTSDAQGLFRKYSALSISGTVVPRAILFSREWCQKQRDLVSDEFLAEELAYVRDNPHREQIERVFREAAIAYGRVDYGVRDGRMEVWEINTNPTLMSWRTVVDVEREAVHRLFYERLAAAWTPLLQQAGGGTGGRGGYPVERARAVWHMGLDWLKGQADIIRRRRQLRAQPARGAGTSNTG